METNTLQRAYIIQKLRFYSIYLFSYVYSESPVVSVVRYYTTFSEFLHFKNLNGHKTAEKACQKDNVLVEFHINLSFGSEFVHSSDCNFELAIHQKLSAI